MFTLFGKLYLEEGVIVNVDVYRIALNNYGKNNLESFAPHINL